MIGKDGMSKRTWICVVMGVLLLGTLKGLCTESAAVSDAVLDTIAQINHMNWVVTKINHYNNALVLEEEYNKISPGMLNLNRIPDKETLDKITALLDELHSMRKDEREMKHWREHFDAECRQKQLEHWNSRVGNVVEKVVSTTGGAVTKVATGDYVGAAANVAKEVAATSFDEYTAYQSFANKLEAEADKKLFEFETKRLDAVHKRNKEMLQDQWNLIRKHKLDDSLRVAESDLLALIEILKDPDPTHIYPRIEPMKSRFPFFPVYWFYLSSAALEASEYAVGLNACDTFFKVNRGLFRDDPMAGIVALNKAIMMEKSDTSKEEVRRCLDEYRTKTACNPDWRRDYVCASLYSVILGDKKAAVHVLNRSIALLENNVKNDLGTLRSMTAKDDADIPNGEADFPDGDALLQCRRLLAKIESGGDVAVEEVALKRLAHGGLSSTIEKLQFVGKLSAQQIWDAIKDDVEMLSLKCDTSIRRSGKVAWKRNRELVARIPVRWFLSGGFKVTVGLLCGASQKATLIEDKKLRRAFSSDIIELRFPVEKSELEKADSFALEFRHPQYPSRMVFASASPYGEKKKKKVVGLSLPGKFAADRLCEDLSLYEVKVCGVDFSRVFEKSGKVTFCSNANAEGWSVGFSKVFRHLAKVQKGVNPIGREYVIAVEIGQDGVTIKYENTGDAPVKPNVSVYLLNRYGAIVARLDDVWRFKKIAVGDKAESKTFKCNMLENVEYIDVELE